MIAFSPEFRNPAGLRGGYQYVVASWPGKATAWNVRMFAFGEMLPTAENSVELTNDIAKTGARIPRITCRHGANELSLTKRMAEVGVELCRLGLGATDAHSQPASVAGDAIHEVGTCRMGRDPKTSMLDGFCRSHEVRGLVVVDGSAFVTLPEKNPTLTMRAIASRAATRLAEDLLR